MLRYAVVLMAMLLTVPLAAQQKLAEPFDRWETPDADKPNPSGWLAMRPKLGYRLGKADDRTYLDATAQPGGSSFHGWNWAVRRPLGFEGKATRYRLSFDVYFKWYTGPVVWLGASDGKTTSGYGVCMMQHHTTGTRIDVVKFDKAEYKNGGGSGTVTGLYRKAELTDWTSQMGKMAALKLDAWERIEMLVEKQPDGAVRCRVYFGGHDWPVLDVTDPEGIDPATFTHVNLSAKGTGEKYPVYLDNLMVEAMPEARAPEEE